MIIPPAIPTTTPAAQQLTLRRPTCSARGLPSANFFQRLFDRRFVEVVEGTGDAEFAVGYVESSVPERLGPLKQDEDGSSYYGKRIHAG